ncbi:MAG: S8 family serine peptidase [Candidatus Eremiobacteraeota bacterium]|nr:S8 family serine peptidase [Candidatus Eremiobacteraeota bacterium]
MKHRLASTLSALLVASMLAACGGGGGSGSGSPPTAAPTQTPTGLPSSSTKTVGVNSSGSSTVTFDTITGGIGVTVTVPPTKSGSATLTATLTTTPPNGVPTISDALRRPQTVGGNLTPIAYVTISSSANAEFLLTPAVSATVPAGVATYGYLGYYHPALTGQSNNWQAVSGATTLVGGKFTFSVLDADYTVSSGASATFAIFSSTALVSVVAPPGNSDSLSCSSYADSPRGERLAPRANSMLSSIVPNRLYVTRSADGRFASSVRSAVSTVRTVALGTQNGVVHEAITLAPGVDATKATAALRATAGVIDVAPIHRRFLAGDSAANDPELNNDNQWYLYITNVDPGAWNVTHGSGIKVAVIDTGIDETNQDLMPKTDKTESIVGGIITSSAQDTNDHGTNVAGLVAAQPNNGYGFAGTGWDVHLLAYKIFPDATSETDCQGADTADEAAAINDAVTNGASVISLSLGSPQSQGVDQAERNAINAALASNVTGVAAAGNEFGTGSDGNQPDYPAAYAGVIAVGASTAINSVANNYASITGEGIASYSNSGPTLVAPGGDASNDSGPIDNLHWILGYGTTTASKVSDRCTGMQGDCEFLFNGTSQATPQVSGAVALLMAKHGGLRSLTPAQVMSILTSTAHPLSGISATRQGAGRLDVAAALAHP